MRMNYNPMLFSWLYHPAIRGSMLKMSKSRVNKYTPKPKGTNRAELRRAAKLATK